jgi:hypothetical protein
MTGSGDNSGANAPAPDNQAAGANALWGGRFEGGPAAVMAEINASIPFDKRLWRQDLAASVAHARMLSAQGIRLILA